MSVKREPKGNERHCPKHPEIVLTKGGDCPSCAMELAVAKRSLQGWDKVDTSTDDMHAEGALGAAIKRKLNPEPDPAALTDENLLKDIEAIEQYGGDEVWLVRLKAEAKKRGLGTGEIAGPDKTITVAPKPKKGKPPVDWTKPVHVADGSHVEVISTKGRDPAFPVLVYMGHEDRDVFEVDTTGSRIRTPSGSVYPTHIVNVPPTLKVWVNFYPTKQTSGDPFVVTMHMSETEAAKLRGPTCTLSLPVEVPTEVQS